MKLFDSSLTPEEQQLAWYVDRKVVLDDVSKRLEWKPDTASNVIVYHGPGGIGKTSVRKMVESLLLKPAEIPYVVVDYEPDGSPRSAERTFAYMRKQLGRYGLKFPAFNLVWAKYWEETTQQRITSIKFPAELEDAADILSIIPVLGNIPQAITALAKLSQSLVQWLSQRFGKGGIARLQQMSAVELMRLMPEAIARDLEEIMGEKRNRGNQQDSRITIIFDGYERLAEHGVDDWFVREFCQASGSTLKIVFGRELIKWDRLQSVWKQHLDHYPALVNLSSEDAKEYLRKREVTEGTLAQHLVDLTDGFPYHLQLAADLCQQIKETSGREPTIEDFEASEKSSNLADTLLSSLLRQLEKDEYDVAMLASIPRWFNTQIIEILVAEPASVPRLFNALTRFSFCEQIPDLPESYILRKEARKLLRNRSHKLSHWIAWNKKLRDYHAQYSSDLVHLAEEIYHGFIVDPDTTLKLFHTNFYHALYTWRFGDCWILIQSVPSESELPSNISQRITLARIALLQEDWQSKERLDLASTLIRSLLSQKPSPEIESRAFRLAALVNIKLGNRDQGLAELKQAATIFDSINDLELKAGTLRDLGDLYYSIGDIKNALDFHQEAITIRRNIITTKDVISESQLEAGGRIIGLPLSDSLRAVSSLYARTGRTLLAIKSLEEMLDEGRRDNNTRIQAEALSELGLVYRRLGRLREAEKAYRDAIPMFEKLRAFTGKGHVLCGLGMTLEQGGNIEAAQPYYQQSLRLFEEIGDVYGEAKNWHCLARVHHRFGNHERAIELYKKSLKLYRDMKHIANTGTILIDLAKLHLDLNELSEVSPLCEDAIGIFEGLDDQTAIAMNYVNLGISYFLQSRLDLALNFWRKAQTIYEKLNPVTIAALTKQEGLNLELKSSILGMWVNWLSMYTPNIQSDTYSHLSSMVSELEKIVDNKSNNIH